MMADVEFDSNLDKRGLLYQLYKIQKINHILVNFHYYEL